jgi:hypothetical protein
LNVNRKSTVVTLKTDVLKFTVHLQEILVYELEEAGSKEPEAGSKKPGGFLLRVRFEG